MIKIELEISDNRVFQEIALLLDSTLFQKYLETWSDTQESREKLIDDLKGIIKTYRYPPNCIDMLVSAVTKHKVVDKKITSHYLTAFLFLLTGGKTEEFHFTKDELVISIFANRIKRQKKFILNEINDALNQAMIRTEPLPSDHPLMQDVKPNIREIRDLYWERLLNHTSTKILAKKYTKEENTINKQIVNYRTLLQHFV